MNLEMGKRSRIQPKNPNTAEPTQYIRSATHDPQSWSDKSLQP